MSSLQPWVIGRLTGMPVAAHAEALSQGGPAYLTRAFHVSGALAPGNRVQRISRIEECAGGSTGRKLLISVDYACSDPAPNTDLFVKFSRDPEDPIRDRARRQMEAETLIAALSRRPGFPIVVPACLFADYDPATGTGMLVTERIAFGEGNIEPHRDKCLDYRLPDPLDHYQLLVASLARLAGAHRGGLLDPAIVARFPFDQQAAAGSDPIRYDARQLRNRVTRYAAFAERYPQLVPAQLRTPRFIAAFAAGSTRFHEHEALIKVHLTTRPDLIALCHWNANIDNAWFWRDEAGALQCGLMDWGRAGQMNVALALWGALSAAEPEMLDRHLHDLLSLFAREYHAAGGPSIEVGELERHFDLFVATMGLAWLMDAPPLIERRFPDLDAIESKADPRFAADETARTQLHMLLNFLHLWERRDYGAVLDRFLAEHN